MDKKYEVWTEGYSVTGNTGRATYMGETIADTFVAAFHIVINEGLDVYDPNIDKYIVNLKGRVPTVWACRCFNNEGDARKSFG